jgi:hypothetical protein
MEEKKGTIASNLQDLQNKIKVMNFRLAEITSQGKDTAALHITAEILTVNEKICELKAALLQIQKEAYFTSLERKRKLGVKKKLQDELLESKQKQLIQKKIQEKVKKEGLAAALDAAQDIAAKIKRKKVKLQSEKRLSKRVADTDEVIVKDENYYHEEEGQRIDEEEEDGEESECEEKNHQLLESLITGSQKSPQDDTFKDELSSTDRYAAGNAMYAVKTLYKVAPP